MQILTSSHLHKSGWTSAPDPSLDSPRTLVVAFGPSGLLDDPTELSDVLERFPQAHILGCSTSGEIHGIRVRDDSIALAVVRFERTDLRTALARVADPSESYEAGQTLARTLAADNLRAVLVLSDGLLVNGSELVRGLNALLPAAVVISGGLAGDGDRFQRTWVLDGRVPSTGCISAVGFYGEHVRVGHGSKGGWDVFGVERRITRSEGNVLYELDNRPALALYKEYLGELAAGLPATALLFPLAIRAEAGGGERLVRTVLAVDEELQSMTFAGDVPQGASAQLMHANFDRLVEGAEEAARLTSLAAHPSDALAIAISCVGRRLVLGDRIEEEVEATQGVLPAGTHQVGFYSYGELSPHASGRCDLHNQTMTLTVLAEV